MTEESDFIGAKLALFLGPRLVVIRRDDRPGLPWPGALDLPGGGREGRESPAACVLRETAEELGLVLPAAALVWGRAFRRPGDGAQGWFFAAHQPAALVRDIRFGDEGQGWALMAPRDYIAHPDAVPHFRDRLRLYLADCPPPLTAAPGGPITAPGAIGDATG